jgi:cytochrome P450
LRRVEELELPFVDLAGPEFDADPFAVFAAARRTSWLARTGSGYAVLGHAQAREILRRPAFRFDFTYIDRASSEYVYAKAREHIQSLHGPAHVRLRGLAVRALRARVVEALRPSLREIAGRLLDAVAGDGGSCDLVRDVTDPYPALVMAPILGIPEADCDAVAGWAADLLLVFDAARFAEQVGRVEAGWRGLERYLGELLADRRRNLGDDVYSELIRAQVDEGRLDDDELVMLATAITQAAIDTTRGQLGLTLEALIRHADQWQRLVADRELAPSAVDEGMRYAPAIGGIPHVAVAATEVDGIGFAAGTPVEIHPRATNRDPAAFDEPERFDVGRDARRHLTFGFGPHACVGAPLARVEMDELLRALASRFAALELAGEPERSPMSSNGNLRTLPVGFERALAPTR